MSTRALSGLGWATLPGWVHGVLGSAALLLVWQGVVGATRFGNGTVPTPLAILGRMASDGPAFYAASALHTLRAAALGWLWGNGLAVALALLAVAAPALARGIFQLGVVSFCLPIVAIGPVLVIVCSGDVPRIALAAMSVFFTTLVAATIGLRGADKTMLDLVHAFGGGSRDQLAKVRFRSALPSLFVGLRIAAPSAVLGSIVAEFLGAENGLGVILINSQQALNFPRTWAIIIVATLVAGVVYAATGLVAGLLTPWAREVAPNLAAGVGATARRSQAGLTATVLRGVLSAVASLALVLVAWWALLRLFDVSPFIGKGPLDVWAFLTDADAGADNRAALLADTLVSVRDASIGLVAGSVAAVATALAFTVWPTLRRMLMGPSLVLQSMPLIAVTPLIVLIFGRSLLAIAVIGGIIAFFPTLVNVSLALARTPKQAIDLAHVYGGSPLATLVKVRIPMALPALFASLRIAAPLSMTGAMLGEWLATGKGLGYAILEATATSDYDGLWARVALVTAFSIALYQLIGAVEQVVLNRFGDRAA